jgi:Electron transfer DM13.
MRQVIRPGVLIPVGLVMVLVMGLGMYLFQPWRLFTNVEVREAAPTSVSDLGSQAPEPNAPPPPTASATGGGEASSPSPTPVDAEPVALATGSFISHEHETTGEVTIWELPDGTRVLRIEGLQTSDGPDLKVWLSDQPVIDGVDGWGVFDDGAYASLGDLKGNIGDQNYVIPADVDLDDFSAVSIWCERFAVSFGAAELRT